MSARLARRGWHRPCQGMGRWAESLEITHTEMQIHLQLDRGWLEPKHRRTHPAASRSPHRSPPVPATRGLGKNKVSRCLRISRATASLSLSCMRRAFPPTSWHSVHIRPSHSLLGKVTLTSWPRTQDHAPGLSPDTTWPSYLPSGGKPSFGASTRSRPPLTLC